MSKQHHFLKTETEYFQAIEQGRKKFELRKNDRDFKVGDLLHLKETIGGVFTGRELPPFEIQYILLGGKFGLNDEYCVINW